MVNRSYIPSYYDSADSSLSPAQMCAQSITKDAQNLNRINGLISGSQSGGARRRSRQQQRRNRSRKQQSRNNKRQQRGGGRTFDVPLPTDPFQMPGPTYNNAWYTGEPCVGNHCGYPITPFVSDYINKALTIGNNPPPGATTQYPVIDRPGNSLGEDLPGVSLYEGTELNPGPFNIRCVSEQTGGARRRSRKQQRRSRSRKQQSRNKKRQQRRY